MIDVWLDDVRPAPVGWHHVKTIAEARTVLEHTFVRRLSLDHDLGWCAECSKDTAVKGFAAVIGPCVHVGTGYDLVCWMEETGHWPIEKPTVHSANPEGARRMRLAIDAAERRGQWS